MCQASYAAKILKRSGLVNCNSVQIPMEARQKLSKKSIAPPVDATQYRSIVGSLRYLVNTRLDISDAVGIISRFMESPTTQHMVAVKQILRYVRGTLDLECMYMKKGEQEPHLVRYSDSDMAGDMDDRKSTTGVAYYLGSNLVTWVS